MSNWLPHPIILKGEIVELRPLEKEHFNELIALAKDERIWEFYSINGAKEDRLLIALESGLIDREHGNQYPFVIYHKKEQKLIGSTRYIDIHPYHKKLEIGWTWLHPDYWASAVNLECKLLLLTYAFENLKAVRVQLKTDENNIRSRKAIQKIGGQFEGIQRQDMIRDNGTHRNSAYFGLIDKEWKNTKENLEKLYQEKKP